MRRRWLPCCILLCLIVAGGARAAPGLKALHRAGQTFLTWQEIDRLPAGGTLTWGQAKKLLADSPWTYRLHASEKPITAANVAKADVLGEVKPLSGWNLNGRNVEYLIGEAMKQPDERGELARNYNGFIRRWHMDHPRMDRYPLNRFVIDEKAGPLPTGTGLFVHTPQGPGKPRYLAVVARRTGDAAEDRFLGATATAFKEQPSPARPVCQGDGLWGPFYDYPGKRKVYVQWTNDGRDNQYFNWSVLVPPDVEAPASVELYFHSGHYSYAKPNAKFLANSIQIAPHDWPFSGWFGYRTDERSRTVRNSTQARIAAFVQAMIADPAVPIDPKRIIAVGGDGAAMMALTYPDLFAYVLITGFSSDVLNPKRRDAYEAAWGPKSPEITDAAVKRGSWQWAELDKRIAANVGRDLPLFVCRGRSWAGDKRWGMGRGRFYTAMKAARQPLYAHWAWGGTLAMPDKWTGLWRGLDLTNTTPVPAFANSSLDTEGEGSGQTNAVYAWKDVKDTPDEFAVTITGRQSTFDLTPRRLQQFKPRTGETLRWTAKTLPDRRTKDAPLQSGTVTVDAHGLVTLKQLKLTGGGLVVQIRRSGP